MASIKDTGTGGINLNGDVYTMDVFEEGSTDDSAGGKYGKWNSGDIKVDKSKKDISTPTKETFAKYLSKTTLGKEGTAADLPLRPNPYPIGIDDSTKLREVSLRDVDGNPMKPSITPNESSFAPEFNQTIAAPNGAPVKKGYSTVNNPAIPDGNNLLRNAAIPADVDPEGKYVRTSKGLADPLKGYISQVLKVNRFSPIDNSGGFVPEYLSANSVKFVTDEKFDDNSSFVNPDKLKFGTSPGNNDSTKREYGFKRLAKIAPILQKNATYLNVEGGSPSESKENSNISSQGGNVSSVEDLSQPIERLNIESIIRNLPQEVIKPDELTDFGSKFETTLNNIVDRFSGLSNETQVATAAALVSSVFNAFKMIEERVESGNIPLGVTTRYRGSGRQGIGSYYGGTTEPNYQSNSNPSLTKKLQLINIIPTAKPYKEAVILGINLFYKINRSTNLPTLSRPNETVNYSTILSRSIIRSSTRMSMLLKEVNEIKNISPDEKSLEIIKIIRDSRLVGIFNFFAQIGDVGTSVSGETLFDVSQTIDNTRKISIIDSADDDNSATRYGKSRLFQGRVRKLAWAVNQTNDLLLSSPTSYFDLTKKLDGPTSVLPSRDLDPTSTTRMLFSDGDIGRISENTRDSIERSFDAEYVPFYFHDVRTNEIVGFHAFILSLSEDYSAAYDAVEGFGRVEPVRVYKNTQRKISLSFIAAALDSKDFDALWFKINKLTTLMYPQYTSGKRVSNDSYSFVKPFTQAIGASPLVRLRLGNLITSNYSKFNLSKVFGLQENDTVLNEVDRTGKFKLQKNRDAKIADARQKASESIGKATEANEKLKKELATGSRQYGPDYLWKVKEGEIIFLAASNTNDSEENKNSTDNLKKSYNVYASDTKGKKGIFALNNPADYFIGVKLLEVVKEYKEHTTKTKGKDGKEKIEKLYYSVDPGDNKSYTVDIVTEPIDIQKVYSDDTRFVCRAEFVDLYQTVSLGYGNQANRTEEEQKKFNDHLAKKMKQQNAYYPLEEKFEQPSIPEKFLISKSQLQELYPLSKKQYDETIKLALDLSTSTQDALIAEANAKLSQESEQVRQEYEEAIKKGPGDSAARYAEEVATFMDPRNNTIVRSFRSAGGQGLAGFIESMQFDWMAGTWDTSDERKAPKMCKITMSFTPVHDIPPGLSSDGQNRAPIYQIGVQRPKIPGV
jgi:hypothetical protein